MCQNSLHFFLHLFLFSRFDAGHLRSHHHLCVGNQVKTLMEAHLFRGVSQLIQSMHVSMYVCVSHLFNGIDPDTGSVDLDLICVHGRVGHQDLGVLYPLGLAHTNGFLQDEALIQIGFLVWNKWVRLVSEAAQSKSSLKR